MYSVLLMFGAFYTNSTSLSFMPDIVLSEMTSAQRDCKQPVVHGINPHLNLMMLWDGQV